MLQILFGDDELVASDGAYKRALKARKWLYLTSLVIILCILGLYNEGELSSIIKVVSVPEWLLLKSFLFGGIYLYIQYILLIVQLISSYDHSLSSRFLFQKQEELSKVGLLKKEISEKIKKLEMDDKEYIGDKEFIRRSLEAKILSLIEEQNSILKRNPSIMPSGRLTLDDDSIKYRRLESQIVELNEEIDNLKLKYQDDKKRIENIRNQIHDAKIEYEEANSEYLKIKRSDLSTRKFYYYSEIFIDISRLLPPFIVSSFSIYRAAVVAF